MRTYLLMPLSLDCGFHFKWYWIRCYYDTLIYVWNSEDFTLSMDSIKSVVENNKDLFLSLPNFSLPKSKSFLIDTLVISC